MNVLCAVVARGTHVLAEYDQSDAPDDLCELCQEVLPNLSSRSSKQYVFRGYTFNYMIGGDLTYLCITNKDLPDANAAAYAFLRGLKAKVARATDMSSTAITEILRLELAAAGQMVSKIGKMELELTEVADLMKSNIEQVMGRGERIEGLVDKTNMLKAESVGFRSAARNHNRQQYWQQMRGRGVFLLIVLAVVFAALFLSCGRTMCFFRRS
eukprot:GEMP01049809.1.p1 GENE.GEMP01049809.1~~GEMP01049809.1.p1  ORF type:complete len:212 (+),score=45.98 GEMP01049809.1:275-910(+)